MLWILSPWTTDCGTVFFVLGSRHWCIMQHGIGIIRQSYWLRYSSDHSEIAFTRFILNLIRLVNCFAKKGEISKWISLLPQFTLATWYCLMLTAHYSFLSRLIRASYVYYWLTFCLPVLAAKLVVRITYGLTTESTEHGARLACAVAEAERSGIHVTEQQEVVHPGAVPPLPRYSLL